MQSTLYTFPVTLEVVVKVTIRKWGVPLVDWMYRGVGGGFEDRYAYVVGEGGLGYSENFAAGFAPREEVVVVFIGDYKYHGVVGCEGGLIV